MPKLNRYQITFHSEETTTILAFNKDEAILDACALHNQRLPLTERLAGNEITSPYQAVKLVSNLGRV